MRQRQLHASTQAQRAVAHARQVATHPWSDAEVAASLYDECDNARDHDYGEDRSTHLPYLHVLYRDSSEAWATWEQDNKMHFHTHTPVTLR